MFTYFTTLAFVALVRSHAVTELESSGAFRPEFFNVLHPTAGASETPSTTYPISFSLLVSVFGKNFSLDLQRSEFLDSAYQEFKVSESGAITPDSARTAMFLDHCYYHGRVQEDPGGVVAVDLCHGLSGSVMALGEFLHLEPKGDDSKLHPMSFAQQLPHHALRVPAFNFSEISSLVLVQNSSDIPRSRRLFQTETDTNSTDIPTAQRVQPPRTNLTVRVAVVNDKARCDKYGNQTEDSTKAIMNLVAAYYKRGAFDDSVNVKLVGQLSMKDGDAYFHSLKGNGFVDSSAELAKFNNFLYSNRAGVPVHDVAVQMSHKYFASGILGLATVGSACNPRMKGVVASIRSPTDSQNAIIVAHEIGHTFSMYHDGMGNRCSPRGDIMAAYAGTGTGWSQCSLAYADAFLSTFASSCMIRD